MISRGTKPPRLQPTGSLAPSLPDYNHDMHAVVAARRLPFAACRMGSPLREVPLCAYNSQATPGQSV